MTAEELMEIKGKYILRCTVCGSLMVFDAKPVDLRVRSTKCTACKGRVKESVVRTCHICGDVKAAYKHGIMLDDIRCRSCGDSVGFGECPNMKINVYRIGAKDEATE